MTFHFQSLPSHRVVSKFPTLTPSTSKLPKGSNGNRLFVARLMLTKDEHRSPMRTKAESIRRFKIATNASLSSRRERHPSSKDGHFWVNSGNYPQD